MNTLLELLPQIERLGNREAVRWSNGLRTWQWTYRDLHDRALAVAHWLDTLGIRKGSKILLWGENRPEWLAVFWGCVARGVIVVPIDFRFSVELVQKISREAGPRLLIHGMTVAAGAIALEQYDYDQVARLPRCETTGAADIAPDDVVEIVYTSGTTGEPKGVVHRHRNVCSNLEPFEREIHRYRRLAAPFQPIRLLDLLPLSHMFGQSQGLFIPLLLGGAVLFTEEIRPAAILRLCRRHRVSVIVSVPRILENLRHEVERSFDIPAPPAKKGWRGVLLRWWKYRRIHSALGWKFWAFVVGGARVDPDLEDFWSRLGYLVIQGYGLTEASPVVAVNHPFDAQRGSLGKVVPGQDVIIAPDGEILVRGESVTGERGQWLHTGDLGELDAQGRLYFRGRKKDLIVTSEGLNVHPEDVEQVLRAFPQIRDAAVVAVPLNGSEQVHAAIILNDASQDPEIIIRRANERLEAHQRIRGWTVWPDGDFPRTASTMKVRRHEVARRISDGARTSPPPDGEKNAIEAFLSQRPDTRIAEDIGLSSLERVELLSEIENRYGIEIDEDQFAAIRTVGELQRLVEPARDTRSSRAAAHVARHEPLSAWPLSRPIRVLRWFLQRLLVLPLFRHYIPFRTEHAERLRQVDGPAIFAANHTSHLDTVAIFAALPAEWRSRLAPAMSKDFFSAWFTAQSFFRLKTWIAGLQYLLARVVFNAFPLPQEMAGVKRALEYSAGLIERSLALLVYPEGRRTEDGKIHGFQPGIGLMAVRLQVPVIPVYIEGLYQVYSVHHSWPKPGTVRVVFGEPLRFPAHTTYEAAAHTVEAAVHRLRG